MSLEFFIDINLRAALWLWALLSLSYEYYECFLGAKVAGA
jgi:hypothetical protein